MVGVCVCVCVCVRERRGEGGYCHETDWKCHFPLWRTVRKHQYALAYFKWQALDKRANRLCVCVCVCVCGEQKQVTVRSVFPLKNEIPDPFPSLPLRGFFPVCIHLRVCACVCM